MDESLRQNKTPSSNRKNFTQSTKSIPSSIQLNKNTASIKKSELQHNQSEVAVEEVDDQEFNPSSLYVKRRNANMYNTQVQNKFQ